MRDVPPGLAAHLAGAATMTCHAWRLKRRDGGILGFTDHDRDLVFAGMVFAAASGFSASTVESGTGLAADAADLAGAFDSASLAEDDIVAGLYDGATVETFLVNWQSPENEHLLLSTRVLGEVRMAAGAFRAELRGFAAGLDAPHGRIYGRRCDAELGDSRCGKVLSGGFLETASVLSVAEEGALLAAGLDGHAADWFSNGRLTFTTGRLAGLSFRVAEHREGEGGQMLSLWDRPAVPPQPGDVFTLAAGCDKSGETCFAKFGNVLNFRGFPFLPGGDFAYGYADGESEHDGRPIVP